MKRKYTPAQSEKAIYAQGDRSILKIAIGTFVNRLTNTSSSSATFGFLLYLLMVNVPFLLGVWGWTVQLFCRR